MRLVDPLFTARLVCYLMSSIQSTPQPCMDQSELYIGFFYGSQGVIGVIYTSLLLVASSDVAQCDLTTAFFPHKRCLFITKRLCTNLQANFQKTSKSSKKNFNVILIFTLKASSINKGVASFDENVGIFSLLKYIY